MFVPSHDDAVGVTLMGASVVGPDRSDAASLASGCAEPESLPPAPPAPDPSIAPLPSGFDPPPSSAPPHPNIAIPMAQAIPL
jgi:hypothetical protein